MVLPGPVKNGNISEGLLHQGIITDKTVRHDNELTAEIEEVRQAGDQGLGGAIINLLTGVKGKVGHYQVIMLVTRPIQPIAGEGLSSVETIQADVLLGASHRIEMIVYHVNMSRPGQSRI